MMSDESENDIAFEENHENDVYYNKYKLLLEECSQLQRANEILVFRIQEVNKITKRRHKEIQFFRQRLLNIHGEDWSAIPPDILSDEEPDSKSTPNIIPKEKIKQEKLDEGYKDKGLEKTKSDRSKTSKKTTRRRSNKSERDPNAPKRPSNPFFQFCQEQRHLLLDQIIADLKPGEIEPSKRELTRQLALKWNSLSTSDKKIYVDRYERSKEKYNAEMEDYKKSK